MLAVKPPTPPIDTPSGIKTADAPNVANIIPNPTMLMIPPKEKKLLRRRVKIQPTVQSLTLLPHHCACSSSRYKFKCTDI